MGRVAIIGLGEAGTARIIVPVEAAISKGTFGNPVAQASAEATVSC